MGRRGNGEGTIVRRPDGRWMGQIVVGYGPDGKPKRLTVYGKTRQEVAGRLADLAAQRHKGLLPDPTETTLREWASRWLERKAREVRPRTLALYRHELAYALPSLRDPQAPDPLGGMRLQEVKPAHIRAALDALTERGLSIRTVKKVRERLNALFEEALSLEVVARNPVAPVKIRAPRDLPREGAGRTLEPEEVGALLEGLDRYPDPRLALALRLMLACGLRRGEALGLRWEDVDLEGGLLHVRRSWSMEGAKPALTGPKTGRERAVPIPHATLLRLREYRGWWEGFFAGVPTPWVFPGTGDPSRPLDPNTPNHALRRIAKRLGLPPVRVHDLRHTYGSLLLAQGAPLELVAERMGHANPTITLNVYRHLLKEERRGWVIDPEDLARPRAQA
ncbi:tyrosine-type recombinase/integrase [Thermus sp.]|uniref:tyrosine-type recombinase/integrase n=1 Tax=Thermus sp. TaxID=275 RepID=UPI003D12102E